MTPRLRHARKLGPGQAKAEVPPLNGVNSEDRPLYELAARAKGDLGKVNIARRLRTETAVTLKWIAAALHMGTWTHVSNLLAQARQPVTINQTELKLCQ